ncbi:cytochrome b/b6 domain-containing protein [Erythrobacter sp. BLCC-B19]|uniref:cytochrome b/b6 domain-containing protein n=1 Tax=Erythrobacter sp. BLCC-B19 TaxID=3025315 RepID=UPI002362771A|nr:cytochrome b/b6 domain-containing protein [Erythrobacter sp. BLCC-B19]WDA40348.1 cytochrome b/b6 domain-containing protein [Erythrobacter sp. BLCC-B19]
MKRPKHALSTRLWHWINAAAIIVLFMTGLNISNAHRHLYWGDYGFDPKDAWLHVIKFPGWGTIPQHYNLAVARDWHITAAWPFGLGVAFIWIAMLVNGHFRRDLTTRPSDWTPRAVLASIKAHAPGGAAHGYNPVQRILYGMVFGVLLPLMLFTGLAISPGFQAVAPWLLDLLGGRQSARSLHFIAAWGIFGFFVIHLLLALTDWRLIVEMFTGGKRDETAPAPPPPAPPPPVADTQEGVPAHG